MSTLNVTNLVVPGTATISATTLNATTLQSNTINHTNGTNALLIDSAGRVTRPNIPAIALDGSNSAGINFTANAQVLTSTYFSNQISKGGMTWDSVNGRISVPVAGYYYFSVFVYAQPSNTNGNGRFIVRRNNTTNLIVLQTGNGVDGLASGSVLVNMAASDYINMYADSFDLPAAFMGTSHSRAQLFLVG